MKDLRLKEMTEKGVKVRISVLRKVVSDLVESKASQRKISLVDSLIKKISLDGYVHSAWNENGSGTGRITSSGPCLTNLPKEARKALVAEDGKVFVILDWKQMEVRLMGYMAGCKALSEAEDVYQEIADKLGIERGQAKIAMISIQYGAGDDLVERQTGVKGFRKMYEEAYPEVEVLKRRIKVWACAEKEVPLFDGSKLPVEIPEDRRSYEFVKAMNRAVAICIQGSAAAIFKMALAKMNKKGLDVRLCLYDGVVVQCSGKDAYAYVEIRDIMERVLKEKGWKFPVKIKVLEVWE